MTNTMPNIIAALGIKPHKFYAYLDIGQITKVGHAERLSGDKGRSRTLYRVGKPLLRKLGKVVADA